MSLSDEEKNENTEKAIEPVNQDEDPSAFPIPKAKMHAIMEQFEYFALQQREKEGIDLGGLSDSQKDKLLEIISKNDQVYRHFPFVHISNHNPRYFILQRRVPRHLACLCYWSYRGRRRRQIAGAQNPG